METRLKHKSKLNDTVQTDKIRNDTKYLLKKSKD